MKVKVISSKSTDGYVTGEVYEVSGSTLSYWVTCDGHAIEKENAIVSSEDLCNTTLIKITKTFTNLIGSVFVVHRSVPEGHWILDDTVFVPNSCCTVISGPTELHEKYTAIEALKLVLDGDSMRVDTWSPDVYLKFDKLTGAYVFNNGSSCNIDKWINREWERYIVPAKFKVNQYVANATGDIGVIIKDLGVKYNARKYEIKYTLTCDKCVIAGEHELKAILGGRMV